jgi:hypothetical protein
MSQLRSRLAALPLASLGALAIVPAYGSGASLPDALKTCKAIVAPMERLDCYDQIVERSAASSTAAAAPALIAAPTPTIAQPIVTAPAPPAATAPVPPVAAVAPAAKQPVTPDSPKQSFGLYSAEHPAAPKPATSLSATIVALGASANGRTTVTLDGGQLWELDVADALLAKGDSVTIKRATFGSFLMTTPSGRSHRVRRMQ